MNNLNIKKLSDTTLKISDGSVCALGCFDGVHIGHKAVLSRAVKISHEKGLVSVAWTIKGMDRGGFLTSEDEKAALISDLGIDYIAVQDFNVIKEQSAEIFVRETLFGSLCARHAVTGFNFTFGAGGKAGVTELESLLKVGGGSLDVISGIELDGAAVASSRIKALIEAGEVAQASRLLGRQYSIKGEVTHGRRIGRTIGFPTVNIDFGAGIILPARGVYASKVMLSDGAEYRGISNIGVNPTVAANSAARLETNIIGFDGDLYGEIITIELFKRIRDEKKFASLDELKAQIESDILTIRTLNFNLNKDLKL